MQLSKENETELHQTLEDLLDNEKWDEIRRLLSLDYMGKLLRHQNEDGDLLLHRILMKGWMEQPCCDVQLALIKNIAKSYQEGFKVRNKSKALPIHIAMNRRFDSYEVMLALAELWPECLGQEDSDGKVPFHCLLESGRRSTIKKALELYPNGAMLEQNGLLPIHIAAESGNIFQIKSLVNTWEGGLRKPDVHGNIPFHYLVQNAMQLFSCSNPAMSDLFEQLLPLFPDGLKVKNNKAQLPMHLAAMTGAMTNVTTIAEKYRDGLFQRDVQGCFPCHYLVQHPRLDCQVLHNVLAKYPKGLTIANNDGHLPIQLAARAGNINAVEIIAQLCPEMLQVVDSDGNHCFHHLAATCEDTRMFVKLVTMHPEGATYRNKHGRLPIDMVVPNYGLADMSAKLLALGNAYPEGFLRTDQDLVLHSPMQHRIKAFARAAFDANQREKRTN